MAKAVLVMDDMPECCADCYCGHFERDTKELNLVCGATGEDANNVGKPDWCPLRELPEKANHPDYCDNGRFDKGWNACLDEILEERKE
jgi:hypothetical protein